MDYRKVLEPGPWEEASLTSSRCRHCGILWTGRKEPALDKHQDDCIYRALSFCVEELEKRRAEYSELLMAVVVKHEGESRHQTALRYIQEREAICSGPVVATQDKP